jgi:RNA polymerase sigma-70 factor, ECF subfamily
LKQHIGNIINGCANNDRLMQKALYAHCYTDMLRVCNRYTSDHEMSTSLYNDAMFKVFQTIANYTEEGKLMAWIKRIVINTCIDFVRLKIPIQTIELKSYHENEYAIHEKALENISAVEIQKIIKTLPKHIATVFNLYVYDEYTHNEIAEILQIPAGTCRYHLSEARRLLKAKIENNIISLNTTH